MIVTSTTSTATNLFPDVDLRQHFTAEEIQQLNEIISRNAQPTLRTPEEINNLYVRCLRGLLEAEKQLAKSNRLASESTRFTATGEARMAERAANFGPCRHYLFALGTIAFLGLLLGIFVTTFIQPPSIGHYVVGGAIGLLTLSTAFLVVTSKKTWGNTISDR